MCFLSINLDKKTFSINSCKLDQSNLFELFKDVSIFIGLRRH